MAQSRAWLGRSTRPRSAWDRQRPRRADKDTRVFVHKCMNIATPCSALADASCPGPAHRAWQTTGAAHRLAAARQTCRRRRRAGAFRAPGTRPRSARGRPAATCAGSARCGPPTGAACRRRRPTPATARSGPLPARGPTRCPLLSVRHGNQRPYGHCFTSNKHLHRVESVRAL